MTKLFYRNYFLTTSEENIGIYVVVYLCGPKKYYMYVWVADTKKNQWDVQDILLLIKFPGLEQRHLRRNP